MIIVMNRTTLIPILLLVYFSADVFANLPQKIDPVAERDAVASMKGDAAISFISDLLNFDCRSGDCKNGWGIKRIGMGASGRSECDTVPTLLKCTTPAGRYQSGMYEGFWKNGSPNGDGTFKNDNGDQYRGLFKNGKMDGQGIYVFGRNSIFQGSEYKGEFKDDMRHGQGTWTYEDGTSMAGIWERNKYIGTVDEVKRMKEEEAARKAAEREAEAKKREADRKEFERQKKIYNACLVDKASGIDMQIRSLREAVEEVCEAITLDPSWYQRWKYE